MPLAIFLKQYFAANKKYGARDRKQIASLCYNYLRLGFSSRDISDHERILIGTFLFENQPTDLIEYLRPDWNKRITQSFKKKNLIVKNEFSLSKVFPFQNELSEEIGFEDFCKSFFVRPGVFLRIRPKTRIGVLKKLERLKSEYKLIDEDCIELPNSINVEDFFIIDKEVVIQDYNSQKVLDFFKPQYSTTEVLPVKAWDCCAASGGKSILLFDIFNHRIELTVSDIRSSIILNLHQRFKKAGIKSYYYFISDLCNNELQDIEKSHISSSQVIIFDVPCTGSGTWSRTPEQLYFFDHKTIDMFSNEQKKIVSNVVPYLEKNGLFVYITCSVFKRENEDIVKFIVEKFQLQLVQMQLLKGYDKKADTMFVAILKK